ncbi:hypothetical protein Sfulv_46740 [Streptomyces fulvorobeus]|uniref:Uncharacterized protein n=2 Tax=Streptomyces fulvorobeus TaxID=284028 RepID=A0A7J0CDA4_9ACTN|nr:hypothetical protein Sfulv_46740 [Streptomyces fulvorobeus]
MCPCLGIGRHSPRHRLQTVVGRAPRRPAGRPVSGRMTERVHDPQRGTTQARLRDQQAVPRATRPWDVATEQGYAPDSRT